MPYAPTNLYPRNITLEESDELLFLGNIDKNDIIEDAQVELIDNKGDISAVICPTSNKVYYKESYIGDESWKDITYSGSHTNFPVKGYQDNSIIVKFNSKTLPNQTNSNIQCTKTQINYTVDNNQNSTYIITLTLNINNENVDLVLNYFRNSEDGAFYTGIPELDNAPFDFQLYWRYSSIQCLNPQLNSQFSILPLNESKISQSAISHRVSAGSNCSFYKSVFQLDTQKVKIIDNDNETVWYLEFSLFKEWDTTEDGQNNNGFINKIYRASKYRFTLRKNGETQDVTALSSVYTGATEVLSWESLRKDFSWRFLLFGKYYNNLVYQGDWEKVERTKNKFVNTSSNVVENYDYDNQYFIKLNSNYTYKSVSLEPNSTDIYKIAAYDSPTTTTIQYYLYIGGNLIGDPIDFNDTLIEGTSLGKFSGYYYIRKMDTKGSPLDFTEDEKNLLLSKKITYSLIKINNLTNCPFYMYDKSSDTYYARNMGLSSFLFGENCQVTQTYNETSKSYDYSIVFSNKLSILLGEIDISLGVKYYIGGIEITEALTPELSSSQITFSSSIPYIVPEKTITQNIYCQIQRNEEYLTPISHEFMENRSNLFFTHDNRLSPSNFYCVDSSFPTTNAPVSLYTNEIYSVENKYNTVEFFNLDVRITNEGLHNAIHILSKESDRLLNYKIYIYNNENKIFESKKNYSKLIDYWYKDVKPQETYRCEVETTTIEGLVKTFDIVYRNDFNEEDLEIKELYWENDHGQLVTIKNEEEIISETNNVIAKYKDYVSMPLVYFTQFTISPLLDLFYFPISLNIFIWKNFKNQLFKKNIDSILKEFKKLQLYNVSKDNEEFYYFTAQREVMVKEDDNGYCVYSWGDEQQPYQLTMLEDSFVIKYNDRIYNLITEDYFNNNILTFRYSPESSNGQEAFLYIDTSTSNGKWKDTIEGDWIDMDNINIKLVDSTKLKEKEITTCNFNPQKTTYAPPSEWITPAVFGIKPNPEENNENIYEVDPEQIWYFNLDTKAENIDFTTTHNVQQTLSQYPRVGLSNANFMSQSITTKLGYLNEDDMYIRDNGEKLTKFAKFANDGNIKILRLPNGYLIPVDIQLNSNVSQYNLVGEPSDITFKWTQVADHETCVLYGWE